MLGGGRLLCFLLILEQQIHLFQLAGQVRILQMDGMEVRPLLHQLTLVFQQVQMYYLVVLVQMVLATH